MQNPDLQAMIDHYKRDLMKTYNRSGAASSVQAAARVQKAAPSSRAPVGGAAASPAGQADGQPRAMVNTEPAAVPPPQQSENYEEFLRQNPKIGSLKIQAYAGQQAIPLSNVTVTVTKTFDDGVHTLYTLVTDENGIVDNILLPAPDKSASEKPNATIQPFATYDLTASHPGYGTQIFLQTAIFEGVKSIQPIRMIPDGINNNKEGA